MHTSAFFRLFPPPRFIDIHHAGLDISDDFIRCLAYKRDSRELTIGAHTSVAMPTGIMSGGDIIDESGLTEILAGLTKRVDLRHVKASIPEEKAYLFQTDVPDTDIRSIRQNIEFKLEENVPLSAADAVFYFDLMPLSVTGGILRASVSVVPRTYIERYSAILSRVGILPVAFEVVPKAIARAIVAPHSDETIMIVHIMGHKTGIYIASGGVVVFTSTYGWSSLDEMTKEDTGTPPVSFTWAISKEINRIYAYWVSHGGASAPVRRIVLVGTGALKHEGQLQNVIQGANVPVGVADVWQNAFAVERYVPPIKRADSLEYVVSAGLGLFS